MVGSTFGAFVPNTLTLLLLLPATIRTGRTRARRGLTGIIILTANNAVTNTNTDTTGDTACRTTGINVRRLVTNIPRLDRLTGIHNRRIVRVTSRDVAGSGLLRLNHHITRLTSDRSISNVIVARNASALRRATCFLGLIRGASGPVIIINSVHPNATVSTSNVLGLCGTITITDDGRSHNGNMLIAVGSRVRSNHSIDGVVGVGARTFGDT